MQRTLTSGPITSSILLFALPLMFGNLLQQMYNIADTWVVGRFLGADALAAVGSSYTLMTFLTSILLGLCMGSGAAISMQYGSGEYDKMRQSVFQSFALIAGMALVLNLLVYLGLDGILWVLRVPGELRPLMKEYLVIIFLGWPAFGTVDAVLYGLTAMILTSLVIDKIMYGMGSGTLLIIITDKGEEVAARISDVIDRGSTEIKARGSYTQDNKDVLLCACSKSQAYMVRRLAHEVDKNVFIMVTETNEVYGEGFLEAKPKQ